MSSITMNEKDTILHLVFKTAAKYNCGVSVERGIITLTGTTTDLHLCKEEIDNNNPF